MTYDLPYGYIEKLQDEIARLSNENGDLFIKNRLLQDEVNELKNKVIGYKNQILYKERALAKVKADRDRIVHRVTKDKKRLIRRNVEFKAQVEKMKGCENCKYKYIQDSCDLGEGTRTDPCLSCRSNNMWEFGL